MRPVIISLDGNIKGLFVDRNKVTDVFFNGIQLRLYTSGSHKKHEENRRRSLSMNGDCDFYLIFSGNENDQNLTFEELHSKVEDFFILAS